MSTTTRNRLEGRIGDLTLTGEPHASSVFTVIAFRLVLGGTMLFAGLGKFAVIPGGEAFNATGYLANRDPASPVSGLYAAMAESAMLIDAINVIIPVTQVLIGLALIFGAFVRLAALGGGLQMAMFYLGGWEGEWLALFDSTLVYLFGFIVIAALAAGRVGGLDRWIERYEVGGVPLVERFPKLRYLLG